MHLLLKQSAKVMIHSDTHKHFRGKSDFKNAKQTPRVRAKRSGQEAGASVGVDFMSIRSPVRANVFTKTPRGRCCCRGGLYVHPLARQGECLTKTP